MVLGNALLCLLAKMSASHGEKTFAIMDEWDPFVLCSVGYLPHVDYEEITF
jgi:hypothetical protein